MSNSSSTFSHSFRAGETTGAAIISSLSGLSLLCVCLLLLRFLVIFRRIGATSKHRETERTFIVSPIGDSLLFLLVSHMISSFGGVLGATWATNHAITTGWVCYTQAVSLFAGSLGAACWITMLAVQSFFAVVLRKPIGRRTFWVLGFLIWFVVAFSTAAGHAFAERPGSGPFYGPTKEYWCWITPQYNVARLMLHYFPIYVLSFTSAILYIFVVLSSRGWNFGKDSNLYYTSGKQGFWTGREAEEARKKWQISVAMQLVWFPITWAVLTIPFSVLRILNMEGVTISDTAWTIGGTLLALQGPATIAVYFVIRKKILSLGPPVKLRKFSESFRESFGSREKSLLSTGLEEYPSYSTTKAERRSILQPPRELFLSRTRQDTSSRTHHSSLSVETIRGGGRRLFPPASKPPNTMLPRAPPKASGLINIPLSPFAGFPTQTRGEAPYSRMRPLAPTNPRPTSIESAASEYSHYPVGSELDPELADIYAKFAAADDMEAQAGANWPALERKESMLSMYATLGHDVSESRTPVPTIPLPPPPSWATQDQPIKTRRTKRRTGYM